MMRTGRSGDQQSPLRVLRITARETDWEQVRGLHQGQRPSAPHQRAGHMTAIGQPASALIKILACKHMTFLGTFLGQFVVPPLLLFSAT